MEIVSTAPDTQGRVFSPDRTQGRCPGGGWEAASLGFLGLLASPEGGQGWALGLDPTKHNPGLVSGEFKTARSNQSYAHATKYLWAFLREVSANITSDTGPGSMTLPERLPGTAVPSFPLATF